MSLEIKKNDYVDLIYSEFHSWRRRNELTESTRRLGLTLDSWISVSSNEWSNDLCVYHAYVIWKSTDNRYGYIHFSYDAYGDEGRQRYITNFDSPLSEEELIKELQEDEKLFDHKGLASSISKFHSLTVAE